MEIVARTTAIYFFVWICFRSLGKRELAEMTVFDLVLVMVIGDIVQQGITQQDISLTGALLGVGTIVVWILLTSTVTFRFKASRPLLDGLPAVVVQDGRPNFEVMKIERLTLDEVHAAAREQGIASLSDVRVCILEPEGHFTFIRRTPESRSPSGRPVRKEP